LVEAFKLRFGESARDVALERACTAGYAPACYFREQPQTPDEKAAYIRRGCAFSMSGACSTLVQQVATHEIDPAVPTPGFGYRWVKRTTRLTPQRTSVELIAHAGARLVLLDVDQGTAFALVTGFEASDDYDHDDPHLREGPLRRRINQDRDCHGQAAGALCIYLLRSARQAGQRRAGGPVGH